MTITWPFSHQRNGMELGSVTITWPFSHQRNGMENGVDGSVERRLNIGRLFCRRRIVCLRNTLLIFSQGCSVKMAIMT